MTIEFFPGSNKNERTPMQSERMREEDARLRAMFDDKLKAFREKKKSMESHPFSELKNGMTATKTIQVTQDDIMFFAIASGDLNPLHVDEEFAKSTKLKGTVMHGVYSAAIISELLGTLKPGVGTIFKELHIKFDNPLRPGDTVEAYVTVAEIGEKGDVTFDVGTKVNGKNIVTGTALVKAPREAAVLGKQELKDVA